MRLLKLTFNNFLNEKIHVRTTAGWFLKRNIIRALLVTLNWLAQKASKSVSNVFLFYAVVSYCTLHFWIVKSTIGIKGGQQWKERERKRQRRLIHPSLHLLPTVQWHIVPARQKTSRPDINYYITKIFFTYHVFVSLLQNDVRFDLLCS